MSSNDPIGEQAFKQIEFILEYNARIATNLRRANDLIQFAENSSISGQIKDDILRAAVVFLHATLEDFLRYIGSRYIPSGSEAVLNEIGLIGNEDILRPEKFYLGKLARHRSKKVDDLITESVEAHLEKRSFSNTNEISHLLKSVRVPSRVVEKLYPTLAALMTRRHEIVHKGDCISFENKQREPEPKAIDAGEVKRWYETVLDFITIVAGCKLGVE